MDKMKRERPDVILLDLQMPRMDGFTFLRKLMAEDPIPVVICSGFAEAGTERAMKALELGAVEIINKPKLGVKDFLQESSVLLTDTVRAAAQARLSRANRDVPAAATNRVNQPQRPEVSSTRIIALGASTGGTDALRVVLTQMPVDCPGIVVVQHMP